MGSSSISYKPTLGLFNVGQTLSTHFRTCGEFSSLTRGVRGQHILGDLLKFTYNGEELVIPESHLSVWQSPGNAIRVERTSSKNNVLITLPEVTEISVNVVPVTKEDDRIHNYQIPSDDCFAHLEVQFRFYGLSSNVEGVLGRTYQPDFKNPAKPGVAMPVVGGEQKYRTTSLVSADCIACVFTQSGKLYQTDSRVMDYGKLDCTGNSFGGNGIVCRK